MASKTAAATRIAELQAELKRATDRHNRQSAMRPQPSGFVSGHTTAWRDRTAAKLAAARKGRPDEWRKPRGAAAQRANGMKGTNGGKVPTAKRTAAATPPPTAAAE